MIVILCRPRTTINYNILLTLCVYREAAARLLYFGRLCTKYIFCPDECAAHFA